MKVREVMTEDVVTVSPQTHVKEVARILGDWQVSGAPVVDGRCNVLGVVSETDVLLNEEAEDAGDGSGSAPSMSGASRARPRRTPARR